MAKRTKKVKARKKRKVKDLAAGRKGRAVKGGMLATAAGGKLAGPITPVPPGGGVPGKIGAVGPCDRPRGLVGPND